MDGIVYNAAKDTLVLYPLGRGTEYTVPATVTNIDVLNRPEYADINISFEQGSSAYRTIDGVTYTN